jgi:hypothetical protein
MSFARARLLIAAALFVGWLCWLGYLAWFKTNPIVVSHSQVMASTNFVVAEVGIDPETSEPKREVHVVEDLRPAGDQVVGEIKVVNIKDARIAGGGKFEEKVNYLLALTRRPTGDFELTPPPRAPGADSGIRSRPWAYRWDHPEVQRQFEMLVPKK